MKRSTLAARAFVAFVATIGLIACSGSGGGGSAQQQQVPKVQLSGTIGGGYSYKGAHGKILSPPVIHAIDTMVAIPMTRGGLYAWSMPERVTSAIGTDGTFSLALPKDRDWLLVLIQSPNTFVGSVALSAGTESILDLPATVTTLSSLNVGTVTGGFNGDAVSSPTITSADFGMNSSQFTAFANADDVFKNAKNIINNYNTTTGIWYQLRPDFEWSGDYAAINSVFSGATWTYLNYHFQMDTNATNLTIQDLCTGGTGSFVSVGWRPPTTVTTVGLNTYNNSTPILNSSATCTTYQSDGGTAWQAQGGSFYATDAYWNPTDTTYGTISYSVQEWFSGAIPSGSGNWTWEEGGVVKASFDPSVSTPVAGDGIRSLGYVPSIKLTTAGVDSPITAIEVEWWYFDTASDTYVKVTSAEDLAVMSHFIERAEIIIESGNGVTTRRHSSFDFDPTAATKYTLTLPSSGADSWTYADNNSVTAFNDSDAGTVGVFYDSGGIGRYYFARAAF